MKKIILAVLITSTIAHADWGFHSVKKAVPLTPDEKAIVAKQRADGVKDQSIELEFDKKYHLLTNWVRTPREMETFLQYDLERDAWNTLSGSIYGNLDNATTAAEVNTAISHVEKLKTMLVTWGKTAAKRDIEIQRLLPEAATDGFWDTHAQKTVNRGEMEIQRLQSYAVAKIARLKRDAEAEYCLSHCKSASTPEEIEASTPHFSLFQCANLSDDGFLKAFHRTREEYDADFKKRMLIEPRDSRIQIIQRVINPEPLMVRDTANSRQRMEDDRMMYDAAIESRVAALEDAKNAAEIHACFESTRQMCNDRQKVINESFERAYADPGPSTGVMIMGERGGLHPAIILNY
jgi:hypothetical protein